MDEASELLMGMGFRKPISKLKMDDKAMIKNNLIDYYCLLKVKAEMDQFAEGLQDLGLLDMMRRQPALFKNLFVASTAAHLTPGKPIIIIVGGQCKHWFPNHCVVVVWIGSPHTCGYL